MQNKQKKKQKKKKQEKTNFIPTGYKSIAIKWGRWNAFFFVFIFFWKFQIVLRNKTKRFILMVSDFLIYINKFLSNFFFHILFFSLIECFCFLFLNKIKLWKQFLCFFFLFLKILQTNLNNVLFAVVINLYEFFFYKKNMKKKLKQQKSLYSSWSLSWKVFK